MRNKKSALIRSALAAVLISGAITVPAFAASDPSDDVSSYSFYTGRQKNAGIQSAWAELPENPSDEELENFFQSHAIGGAYVDGVYDEAAKEN